MLESAGSGSLHCRFDHLGIEILQSGKVGKRPLQLAVGELRK